MVRVIPLSPLSPPPSYPRLPSPTSAFNPLSSNTPRVPASDDLPGGYHEQRQFYVCGFLEANEPRLLIPYSVTTFTRAPLRPAALYSRSLSGPTLPPLPLACHCRSQRRFSCCRYHYWSYDPSWSIMHVVLSVLGMLSQLTNWLSVAFLPVYHPSQGRFFFCHPLSSCAWPCLKCPAVLPNLALVVCPEEQKETFSRTHASKSMIALSPGVRFSCPNF